MEFTRVQVAFRRRLPVATVTHQRVSKEVKRAAKFAVDQRTLRVPATRSLVWVVKAKMRVVAGLNYRMVLRVSDKRGRRRTATVVVYQNLKNRLSLTGWKSSENRE